MRQNRERLNAFLAGSVAWPTILCAIAGYWPTAILGAACCALCLASTLRNWIADVVPKFSHTVNIAFRDGVIFDAKRFVALVNAAIQSCGGDIR